nr:pre-mRNA-splicing factor ATP-dependent RNA helicase DEAH7 [Tanacetum cinerariifolium]
MLVIKIFSERKKIDADTSLVGEHGEVDFKGDATFARHMKKGEAVSDFAKSKSISEQRQYLPVFSVRNEFLQVVRENQVMVVVGETGSGKTTQLTQYLHEDGYTENGIVGCTQPRRVAAMSVAKRVSEEMETELGDSVGYAIRFENITGTNTYMTEGVLLRETLEYADLDKYRLLPGAETSSLSLLPPLSMQNSSQISSGVLQSLTFPVQIMYSKSPCEDYVEAAVKQAMTMHITSAPGGILIFMTGQDETEATCYALSEHMEQLVNSSTRKEVANMFSQSARQRLTSGQPVPEIQRSNIGNVILLLKSLKVDDLLDFEFMDPPPQENILNSMYQLWVAIPRYRAEESAAAHEKFFVPESDHLTLLNIYRQWEANKYRGNWCSKHFQVKSLHNARKVRSQLLDKLERLKIALTSCGTKRHVIRKAICSSHFHNAARLKGGIEEYVNCRNGMPCHLHPSSTIYGTGYTPDYVVYHELTLTTKEYMQCATSVEPQWLA